MVITTESGPSKVAAPAGEEPSRSLKLTAPIPHETISLKNSVSSANLDNWRAEIASAAQSQSPLDLQRNLVLNASSPKMSPADLLRPRLQPVYHELLTVEPGDILLDEDRARTEHAAEMKALQARGIMGGTDLLSYMNRLKTEGTSPLPLQDRAREIGGVRSKYDAALSVQKLAEVYAEGRIKLTPGSMFGIDRIYRKEAEINADLGRSLRFLGAAHSEIKDLGIEERTRLETKLTREFLDKHKN